MLRGSSTKWPQPRRRSAWSRTAAGRVLEVRPPVTADKGTAVRRLLTERPVTRALYAGDDTTDLDAFRGLEEADLDVALKVTVGSPEMNPALLTRADIVVDGPGELLSLLRTL